ncbi:MAG: TIGR01459 family HAD-type hydrolase [Paracoccaceae bacterium]
MTELITNLSDISKRYDAIFCDLWGCLHDGVEPFSEAVAALQKFRSSGGIVVLMTNASRPKPSVIRHLDQMGVPRDAYDDVVSSGDASQLAMVSGLVGHKVYHLGPERNDEFFTDMPPELDAGSITRVSLQDAEGIVCTGLLDEKDKTPEDCRATLLYAKNKGLKLLCTNPDLLVDVGGTRVYCPGTVAALYTEMGGESYYFGKPYPPIYDLARRRLSASRPVRDDRVLCIGDGIKTDIQGGLSEGFDTLFITGGLAANQFGPDINAPDPALMQSYFDDNQLSPTAAIPFLR